jgi:ATP-dependent DNA ligase
MEIEKFTFFYPEKPRMISSDGNLFDLLSKKREVVAEKKYNGIRLQLHFMPDGSFQFWNRHNVRLQYLPGQELSEAMDQLGLEGYNVLDGELRHGKVKGVKHKIVLFDVFVFQNQLLVDKPFFYRRGLLEKLVYADNLQLVQQYRDNFRGVFEFVTREPEIEGLVLKNKTGYLDFGLKSGALSKWMWKVRRPSKKQRFKTGLK